MTKEYMMSIYKRVRSSGSSGTITLPKSLIGEEVEIRFMRMLTKKERELIRLNNLKIEFERLKQLK